MPHLTLFVTVAYAVLLLGFGWALRRGAADGAGFFLAGRGLGAIRVGLSTAATAFGGSAILIASSLVYTHGLVGLWFTGSAAIGFIVLGLGFARRIRATGGHSLADFVGGHYGDAARWLVSALLVVIEVAFLGLTIKAFAILLGPLAGVEAFARSTLVLEVAAAVVMILYTLAGGQRAVVATDVLQFALIVAGLVPGLLPLALVRADLSVLPPAFLDPLAQPAGQPFFILNFLVLMGLSAIIGGDVFSKLLSARDERSAARGAILGGVALAGLAATVAVVALCARVLMPGLERPTLALPLLARELMHPITFQLMILALLSALLSTGSSVAATGATVLTLDVLRLGERAGSRASRIVTLILGAAGLALAVGFDRLLDIMMFGYTLLVAAIVAPVFVTLLLPARRRPRRAFAAAAILAGFAVAVAWRLHPLIPTLDPATAGAAAAAAVMLIGALFPPPSTDDPIRARARES